MKQSGMSKVSDLMKCQTTADDVFEFIAQGLDTPVPVHLWGISEWKAVAFTLYMERIKQGIELGKTYWNEKQLLQEVQRRRQQDKDRIKSRKDQLDKHDFQKAIKENIETYANKAEAIRDLRANSQFADYPDSTLRGWLDAEAWNKPTKRGAPIKPKK
jgi:hypothetical protein